jgi:hypothetical protein
VTEYPGPVGTEAHERFHEWLTQLLNCLREKYLTSAEPGCMHESWTRLQFLIRGGSNSEHELEPKLNQARIIYLRTDHPELRGSKGLPWRAELGRIE